MSKFVRRRQFLITFIGGAVAPLLSSSVKAKPYPPNTLLIGREPDIRIGAAQAAVKELETKFYHDAAYGPSSPFGWTGGLGRQVAFSDSILGRHVREIAADKAEHLALLSLSPNANLAVDLSSRPFRRIAQAAGLVMPSGSFDPYADDESFLLAAHILESAVAPLHRYAGGRGEAAAGVLDRLRADAGYHAGLIRAAIQARRAENTDLGAAADRVSEVFAHFDGENESYGSAAHVALGGLLLGQTWRGHGGFFPGGMPGVHLTDA